jgi:hypothetical protein
LEENSNFHVFDDSLVDVDAKELNVVLSSSGQANIDEEDDIHIEDCDEGDDITAALKINVSWKEWISGIYSLMVNGLV